MLPVDFIYSNCCQLAIDAGLSATRAHDIAEGIVNRYKHGGLTNASAIFKEMKKEIKRQKKLLENSANDPVRRY